MRVKFFRILSHPLAMSVSGVRRLPASLGASFADTARANVCSLSSLWTRCKQVMKGAAVCSSLHQGGKYTPNITKQYMGIYRKSLNSRAGLEECWTSQAGSCCARRTSTNVCKCHADPSSIYLHLLPFFVPNFWCNIFDTAICTDSQHKFRLRNLPPDDFEYPKYLISTVDGIKTLWNATRSTQSTHHTDPSLATSHYSWSEIVTVGIGYR